MFCPLLVCRSCQTGFYDLLVSGETDICLRALQRTQVPAREVALLYRISQLTGTVLDDSVGMCGPTEHLARVASSDVEDIRWSRRTLHE